jgi:CxxC motif-containing protein
MTLNEETKKFLCVSCPVGCLLKVTVRGQDVLRVEDNGCPLGVKYAQNEVVNPVRTFTSTVRVNGASLPVCPVRSRTPLPLSKVGDVTREVALARVTAPISIGQVIIENVCGTGTDIISSRSLEKR